MSFPLFLPSVQAPAEPLRLRPSDITLGVIFAELNAARSANQLERGAPRIGAVGGPRADRLLQSLEACEAALLERNLPVPPGIRDELRLRRSLYIPRGRG
ncbi:hypothetical protein AB0P21_34050 [Kribbella sp. NPDC056861]|jgi:hypothetical protein|uniref:hypothetical protein n=1 Tax=Kribbella sp. NPDC056861 TaxID=3154857 RepID=UPI003426F5F5